MIHLVIGLNGERKEFTEAEARWLAARSTIVVCRNPHYTSRAGLGFYPVKEYTIYHPGTRNGHMITMMDVDTRLAEMPKV